MVYVGIGGRPAGDKAAGEGAVGMALPYLKSHLGDEGIVLAGREDDKLLVGGRKASHRDGVTGKDLLEAGSHRYGVARETQVEAVGKERVELDAEHAPLGQQRAVALDGGKEILRRADAGKHHRLAKHGSHLGAADIEHIAMACQEGQVVVAGIGHKSIAQACTVDIESEVVAAARLVEAGELAAGVDHAQLGRHGDIDHARLHHVGRRLVGSKGVHEVVERGGSELAVDGGKRDDLVSDSLDRSRLVYGDVARLDRDDRLAAHEQRVDDGGIGLGATGEEEDIGIGHLHCLAYAPDGRLAVRVRAIARRTVVIGIGKTTEYLGGTSIVVITLKRNHNLSCCKVVIYTLPHRRPTRQAAGTGGCRRKDEGGGCKSNEKQKHNQGNGCQSECRRQVSAYFYAVEGMIYEAVV